MLIVKTREDGCGFIWTGSRSSFVGQTVKPFFRALWIKWLSRSKRDKMAMAGRLLIIFRKLLTCPKNGERVTDLKMSTPMKI
jgi:hypothetical protein